MVQWGHHPGFIKRHELLSASSQPNPKSSPLFLHQASNNHPNPISSLSCGNLPQIIPHRDFFRKKRKEFIISFITNKVSASFPYRFLDAFMAWVGVTIFFPLALLKGVTFLSITCFPGPPACAILGLPIEEKDLLQIRRHSEPWIKCFTYMGCLASVRSWEDIEGILFSVTYLTASGLSCGTLVLPSWCLDWRLDFVVVVCRLSYTIACGILFSWPGIEPASSTLQGKFLTTREVPVKGILGWWIWVPAGALLPSHLCTCPLVDPNSPASTCRSVFPARSLTTAVKGRLWNPLA